MVRLKGSYEVLAEIPDLVGIKIVRLDGAELARVGFNLPDTSATAVFWLLERLRKVVQQIVELDPFELEVKPEHRIKIENEYLKIISEIEIIDCEAGRLLIFPVEFLTLCDFTKKKTDRHGEVAEIVESASNMLIDQQNTPVLRRQRKRLAKVKDTAQERKKEILYKQRGWVEIISVNHFWQMPIGMAIFVAIFVVALGLG